MDLILLIDPAFDEKDVEIIRILQKDPRTTYLALASKCGLSIDSVRRRYQRLKDEGIVVSEILSLVPEAMGLGCNAWLGFITELGKEKEISDCLSKRPEILMNFVEIGKYSIRSILGVKSIQELPSYVDSLKKILGVKDIDVMIWIDMQKMAYPENLIIRPPLGHDAKCRGASPKNERIRTSSTSLFSEETLKNYVPLSSLNPSIDKIDEAILNCLMATARMPFSHIAKQLGISTKTVISRYEKLRKKWVAYATLSLNLKKLGYYGYASYNIKVSSKNWVNEVFEEIVKIPNVIAALKLLGTYDINAVAPFSSPSQLMGIYGAISRITGIEKIDQQIGNSMEMWPGR